MDIPSTDVTTLPRKYQPYDAKRVARHIFTGIDGESVDVGRVLWVLGALVYIAISTYVAWHTKTFDAIAWGTGYGLVNGGAGLALKLKESTEPTEPKEKVA